jgi:branched-subunit amino acid permease
MVSSRFAMSSSCFRISAVALPALTVAALAALSGCNWTTFADDAAKAPVRSIGAPSGSVRRSV